MDLGTEENMLSVSQYQTIKKSIGFATSIGIISCLIPGIGMENSQVSESRIIELSQETLSIMQVQKNNTQIFQVLFEKTNLIKFFLNLPFRNMNDCVIHRKYFQIVSSIYAYVQYYFLILVRCTRHCYNYLLLH